MTPEERARIIEQSALVRPPELEADNTLRPNPDLARETAEANGEPMVSQGRTPYFQRTPSGGFSFPLLEDIASQTWIGGLEADVARERDIRGIRWDQKFDPAYTPTTEQLLEIADRYDLTDAAFEHLARARSGDDLEALGAAYGLRWQREKQIAASATGVEGFMAQSAVSMLDPAFLIAGGGVGNLVRVGAAPTRLGNALRASASALAVDAPLETYKAVTDPGYTAEDAMWAVGTSVILSGGLGALSKGARPEDVERLDAALAAEVSARFNAGSVGAAQAGPVMREFAPADALPEAAPERAGFGRFGTPTFRLASSESPQVRALNEKLGWDPGSKSAQGVTVVEAQRRVFEAGSVYLRRARQAATAYYRERGLKPSPVNPTAQPSTQQLEAFMEEVAQVHAGVRRTDNPHVQAAVQAFREGYEDSLKYLKQSGYNGPGSEGLGGEGLAEWADIEADPQYVMRRFSKPGFGRVSNLLGTDKLKARLAEVIRRSNAEWLEARAAKSLAARGKPQGDAAAALADEAFALSRRVASKYVDTVQALLNRADNAGSPHAPIDAESRRAAVELVRHLYNGGEEFAESAEEAIETVMDLLAPVKRSTKESARAKSRLRLNLDADLDADILPMFDWNAEALFSTYRRQTSGYAGFLKAGFKSVSEVTSQIAELRRGAAALPEQQQLRIAREATLLEQIVDAAIGRAPKWVEGSQEWLYWTTQIRRMNFANLMGNSGFLSLSEVGGAMVQLGPMRLLRSIPEYRKYLAGIRKGDPEALESVYYVSDALMGHGTAQVRSRILGQASRMDDEFTPLDRDNAGARQALDTFTRKAANATSRWSGMGPLTEWLRSAIVGAEAQDWVKAARAGVMPYNERRMRALGVDAAAWDRIAAQLRQMQDITSPDTGQPRPFLDFTKWSDGEAANVFLNAIDRNSRRLVLEGDIGHSSFNLRRPSLSLLFQFLNFPVHAWSKHTTFARNVHDMRAAAETIAMSLGGAVGYMARVGAVGWLTMKSAEERDKYLEEMLKPEEVAKAAFYYSAHASLIPNAIDLPLSAAQVAGFEVSPIFSKSRASGLSADPLIGNATRSRFYNALGATGGVMDGEVSNDDVQRFAKAWAPLGNHILTQTFLNSVDLMGWGEDAEEDEE